MMKIMIKVPDVLVILIAAGVMFYSAYSTYMKPKYSSRVLIRGQTSEWNFPLEAKEVVAVNGPLGITVVHINENRAWVESSPCSNQTCVAAGFVFRQGQWAACLPNNVLLLIEGGASEDVDVISW